MKFLAMHINNQSLRFDIFTVGKSSWNMILISNDFWHKIKMYNFDPYNVLLYKYTGAVMTAFVLQGHVLFHKIKLVVIIKLEDPLWRLCHCLSM